MRMNITIEFLSLPKLSKIVGGKSITFHFNGQTVDDLLTELVNRYGSEMRNFLLDESGKLDAILKILLNKKEWIHRDQTKNKILKDGDRVTLMLLVGGG